MDYFTVEDDVKGKVRESFGVSANSIQRDIDILKEWLKKQPHLPQNIPDDLLESFLLRNKFRIEQTKQKLEGYFTFKCFFNEYFDYKDLVPSKHSVFSCPLGLAEDNSRYFFVKVIEPNADNYSFFDYLRSHLVASELGLRYDYANGCRIIFDMDGFTSDHFKKFSISQFSNMAKFLQEDQSCRLLSAEFFNAPSWTATLLSIMKPFLKKKIADRIRIYENVEELSKVVPKKNLPKDYGGEEPSIKELQAILDKVYVDKRDFFEENRKTHSNEKLRVGKTKFSDLHGVEGTFKKLELD